MMNLKKSKTAKLFAGAIGLGMALSFALPAGAQTTADLTAQINSLLAMIAQLQSQLAAKGGTTTGSSMTFTIDLTIGSKGADVTALQQWLVSKGFLTMPAGAAYGYFGNLTKMAVAKWQASAGISPAAGYFGPKSRAAINAMGTTGGTTTGGTTTGGTTTGGITTPGAEGTISVTGSNAAVVSTAYAGDSKDKVLGFKVQALASDVAVQRVKVNLGTNTTLYNKIFQTLYVVDANGNVLASLPLNSSNVVKDSGTYYATLTGFNYVVPKNTIQQLYIAADLYGTIDSTNQTSYTVQLADNGVRAVDGAGIDLYSPTTGSNVAASVTVGANLTDSATLTLSADSATPATSDVVASTGSSNNQYDQLPVLVFDVKATKDDVTITDAVFGISKSGSGGANASTTLYLYDGSTPIGTGSITNGYASFTNINYVIPKDTTKALTIKTDIRSANGTVSNFSASASSTGLSAQSSNGTSVTAANKSGSITGNTIGVRNVGPVITLTSKSITTAGAPQGGSANTLSTSTLTATFNLHITAVGGALTFGTTASGTPAFASSTTGFKVYRNGAYDSSIGGVSTSTSYSFPSNCAVSGLTNTCQLSQNDSMDVPVTFQLYGRNTIGQAVPSGLYSVEMEGVQWDSTSANTSTFMAGQTSWRTNDVSFP